MSAMEDYHRHLGRRIEAADNARDLLALAWPCVESDAAKGHICMRELSDKITAFLNANPPTIRGEAP